MGGFWNALSVLAPVAPALSDAQDIRADRAKEAQELELRKAQTTVEQFAGQEAQQRLRAGNQPIYKPGSQPEYSSALGTMAQPVWTGDKYELKSVPGDTPQQQEEYQIKSFAKNRAMLKGMLPPGTSDEALDYAAYTYGGMKPPPAKGAYRSIPGLPQNPSGDGKTWVRFMYDPSTNQNVEVPVPDYKPPVKPPVMKPGMGDGRSTEAYYSTDQNAWIDSNTHQPLHQFIPFPTFAQTGLYGIDTGYDAQGNSVPIMLNRRTGQITSAPAGLVAPAQSKGIEAQRTAAIAGDSLLRTMLGAAERAKANPQDQQAALSVVANHIGMTLGAQKGARINQAVWNEATESAPWLQNVQKKWGPDGYLQGVTLSPQQVDQMVELGKLRRDVMWQQTAQTAQAAGVPLQIPPFVEKFTGNPTSNAPGGTGGGPSEHKIGDKKTFPNGNEGAWDGTGWRVTKLAKAVR